MVPSILHDNVYDSLHNAWTEGHDKFLRDSTPERIALDLLEAQDYLYGAADLPEMTVLVAQWKQEHQL